MGLKHIETIPLKWLVYGIVLTTLCCSVGVIHSKIWFCLQTRPFWHTSGGNSGKWSINMVDVTHWWVVGPPLWKIWVRHLGWWPQPNINGKIQFMATKPPTSNPYLCELICWRLSISTDFGMRLSWLGTQFRRWNDQGLRTSEVAEWVYERPIQCHQPWEIPELSGGFLVGGWATPLKNMKVNWDDEIPNIWENKKWQPNHQPVFTFFAVICFIHKSGISQSKTGFFRTGEYSRLRQPFLVNGGRAAGLWSSSEMPSRSRKAMALCHEVPHRPLCHGHCDAWLVIKSWAMILTATDPYFQTLSIQKIYVKSKLLKHKWCQSNNLIQPI